MIALAEGVPVGRYVLTSRLASGGMAEVWLARATGPGGFSKIVVLKTILPQLADDPDFVHMFLDEAALAASLDHPNIVQIFDLGELDGGYFIAMEYIAGKTLRQIKRQLRRARQVPPPWLTLHVCARVCDALHFAHNKTDESGRLLHLVHRDVTSDNIMVSFAGETKVVDFGIAKARTSAAITRAGMLKGKHSYMAPEQITAKSQGIVPDRRIDVYALGVVMYELLTGTRPYRADNDLALLRRIIEPGSPPLPPSQLASWVTPEIEAIVMRAMAKDPRRRFQTAAHMRAAIERYLNSLALYPTPHHVATQLASIFPEEAPRYVVETMKRQSAAPPPRPSGLLAKAPPKPVRPHRTVSGTQTKAQAPDRRRPPLTTKPTPPPPPMPPGFGPQPNRPRQAPPPRRSTTPAPQARREPPARNPSSPAGAAFDRASRERAEQTQANALPPGVWDRLTQIVREQAAQERRQLATDSNPAEPAEVAEPAANDPVPDARQHFERGLELFLQRDLAGSLAELERALELEPENRLYQSNVKLVRTRIAANGYGSGPTSPRAGSSVK